MKIVVINSGFVFVCREYDGQDGTATLTKARCIRVWGTSMGLGELCTGPTNYTKLDAMIPVISVPIGQIVFTFTVTDAWDKHL